MQGAAIRDGSHKSELVRDLYIVQQPSQSIEKNSKTQDHTKSNKSNTKKQTSQTQPRQNKQATWKVIGGPVQRLMKKANPARLPLDMGILQPDIPVRRMANERKTKLTDALVQILRRLLTPATVTLSGLHDLYLRDNLLALAGHGEGHILTVTVALLLAILTGRSDLCIAGVFGAGKTRSLAVLLIALSCELDDFSAVIYTKENVAAKALADQISDLSPPTLTQFGRLLGRIEEGKGEAYATKIDVRCNDRNRIIASKRILIATGGSATAEMSMRYSNFSQWLSRVWLAFMDESQKYGNCHEIAALAAIQQPALIVFVGDHFFRPTPSWLPPGRSTRSIACFKLGCKS